MADHKTPLGEWLASKNIKPARFARTIGVSRSYLSELLSGSKYPARDLALQIQSETGIAASVLMDLEPPAASQPVHEGAGA